MEYCYIWTPECMVVGMLQDMRANAEFRGMHCTAKAPQSFRGANDSSPIAGVTKTVQHNAESCHPGGADIFQPREPLRGEHCSKVALVCFLLPEEFFAGAAGPQDMELESAAGSLDRTDSAA